jgi:hypothetical protein
MIDSRIMMKLLLASRAPTAKISKAPLRGRSGPRPFPNFPAQALPFSRDTGMVGREHRYASTSVQISDPYMHHKIICPFLDVVIL